MSSRSRKKEKPVKKNALITNQPPRRQLKSAAIVITIDEFIKKAREVHGNQYDYSRLGESAVDFIEIRGDAIGEPDYNSINNTNTIVFSKPVLMLDTKGVKGLTDNAHEEDDDESNMGSYGGSRSDDHRLIPQYSEKVLEQITNGFEDSVNLITTTYIKLRKVAADHLDQEIAIQTVKDNKEYVAKLNELKKDSEGWCRHFLCDYFVHLGDIKEELVDEEE